MNIKKKIVRVLVSLLLLTSTVASASPNFKNTFDWQPVIDAIIQVESNGNPKAKSGNSLLYMYSEYVDANVRNASGKNNYDWIVDAQEKTTKQLREKIKEMKEEIAKIEAKMQ